MYYTWLYDSSLRAITWYELYILYRIRGHPKPLADPVRTAHNCATADKQIRAFQKALRGVVAHTVCRSDAHLFKPDKMHKSVLLGLAITGTYPTISCNAYVTDEERKSLANAFVELSTTISAKHCHQYIDDERKILPVNIQLHGKAAWVLGLKAQRVASCKLEQRR